MKKNNKKLKTIVFSLGLGAAMLTAPSVKAQGVFGDMLDNYYEERDEANHGALLRQGNGSGYSIATEQFGNSTSGAYNIGTEQFGQNAPLGSGLFIMAAAGAAYAFKKRKMNN